MGCPEKFPLSQMKLYNHCPLYPPRLHSSAWPTHSFVQYSARLWRDDRVRSWLVAFTTGWGWVLRQLVVTVQQRLACVWAEQRRVVCRVIAYLPASGLLGDYSRESGAWTKEVGDQGPQYLCWGHPCYWPLLENAKSASSLAADLGHDWKLLKLLPPNVRF